MSFEGGTRPASLVGEAELPGRHHYFLGSDPSRWRAEVPIYASVRYEALYPGIDLRLRHADGHPEYDLLLSPGADLRAVSVRVHGADGLHIAEDASLVIDTALGPVSQPLPRTWQMGAGGAKQALACRYVILDHDRFGFAVPGWDGSSPLTIDPGLIWSTHLGGNSVEEALAVSVGDDGAVTVAGGTQSVDFPTTPGAYDTTFNASAFVSRLDPRKIGSAQLIYSTFLGGTAGADTAVALVVDGGGVVTIAGQTRGSNFPTTTGTYDSTFNGGFYDAFLSRLDPSRKGSAQLVYSTLLGGFSDDWIVSLATDAAGVVTVGGTTWSSDFPTTAGAFATSHSGGPQHAREDAFVSQLDPQKTGSAQLVYSTYLGGKQQDTMGTVSVDILKGMITVVGTTFSSDFPTTSSAYNTSINGSSDVFVTRLDPTKIAAAQLVYSTFFGGSSADFGAAAEPVVDVGGTVTVVGVTASGDLPTTVGAYDRTHNGGGALPTDVSISQLDPRKTASTQLIYSTFLGGKGDDNAIRLSRVDSNGGVVLAGSTSSSGFPVTADAWDATHNGQEDVFVARMDPARAGSGQLVYSTFLGGGGIDRANALAVDLSGTATVVGVTRSSSFPTTGAAYDTTLNGQADAFLSRIGMGVALWADVHQLSLKQAGTQKLTLSAGRPHANRAYWIFGSLTGTKPGVKLGGVHFSLNPDIYTDFTIASTNSSILTGFQGTLDSSGAATASFNLPSGLPPLASFTLHHAYLVYDAQKRFYMVSNPVPLQLRNR